MLQLICTPATVVVAVAALHAAEPKVPPHCPLSIWWLLFVVLFWYFTICLSHDYNTLGTKRYLGEGNKVGIWYAI